MLRPRPPTDPALPDSALCDPPPPSSVPPDSVPPDSVPPNSVLPDQRAFTPARAWETLESGNARFAQGTSTRADQGVERRAAVAQQQHPFAVVLGCSDSRVAPEIVFDQGLGHLLVVRTVGHVLDVGVLGSVELGVGAFAVPLVVVLGHSSCGAVATTVDAVDSGVARPGFVQDVVQLITPSVLAARSVAPATVVETEHVRQTVRSLLDRSQVLADAVRDDRCAVVGAVYHLHSGAVRVVDVVGPARARP
ncbi:MAG: carbonic anhydrase [Angustibacter sp.]